MRINEMFNKIVTERGIKQTYIAEKTGWSNNKVSKLLRGALKMTAEDFLTLCSVLDLDPSDFRVPA
jgi:DNA-binding Xre family transcriptional regulator